ncbi:pentapeptide repeat-containing protein [Desulfovibrio sp. OttesenSCG-928-I05]|nr:pentapeptide repeat-containing protein [Desulfovibrio sp. OttesenSCG-928-I05]
MRTETKVATERAKQKDAARRPDPVCRSRRMFFGGMLAALLTACGGRTGNTAAPGTDDAVSLDELARGMPELRDARESVLISKNPARLSGAEIRDTTLKAVSIKDATVKGARFTDCHLPDMSAENIVFEDCVFTGTAIREGTFKNTRFVNCSFLRSTIDDSTLTDCLFQGGVFDGLRAERKHPEINACTFDNTTFDGSVFSYWYAIGNTKGNLRFKNITKVEGHNHSGWALLHGVDVSVTFEDCDIRDAGLVYLTFASSATVRNCTFSRSTISGGDKSVIVLENCRSTGPFTLYSKGRATLRSCTFAPGFKIMGQPDLTLENTVLP